MHPERFTSPRVRCAEPATSGCERERADEPRRLLARSTGSGPRRGRGVHARGFVRCILPAFAVFLCGLTVPPSAAAAPSARPNIILMMADDLGYSDLGCYGSEIATPNLDALAARGVRFTQFYNGAVCCPTRAALLTGLYSHQAGVGWMVNHGEDSRPPGPYQGYLNARCVTLAEVLRGAGYRTLMSGKWHVGESRPHWPVDRGFDRYFGLISGAANYFDPRKTLRASVVRQVVLDDQLFEAPREGFYMTDAIADHAISFLAETGREPRPFFLYVPFTAPHTPLHAKPEDIARHRGRYRIGWDALRVERFRRMQAMGILDEAAQLSPRETGVTPWTEEQEPDLQDLKMAIYAAQVESMDRSIGRILAQLRAIGKERETLIIFLSDNGGSSSENISDRASHLNRSPYLGGPESYESYGRSWGQASNTPYRKFKVWTHEGGIITPLIAVWPGVVTNEGGLCRVPAHIIDLMATFVDISGAAYPKRIGDQEILPMEGISLAPLLRGGAGPRANPTAWEKPICWEYQGNRAVRNGRWKLVAEEGQPWELYDLGRDPTELHNLAAAEPERVQALTRQYEAWAQRCGVAPWNEISGNLTNLPVAPSR